MTGKTPDSGKKNSRGSACIIHVRPELCFAGIHGFMEQSGVKYLIRLHKGDYEAEMAGMLGDDEEVEIACTGPRLASLKEKSPERMRELALQKTKRVRIIKTKFENGEGAGFITNMKEGTAEEVLELYRKWWSIEQKYHTLKNKMKFESVTGKASIYVEQDFWAFTVLQRNLKSWKLSTVISK